MSDLDRFLSGDITVGALVAPVQDNVGAAMRGASGWTDQALIIMGGLAPSRMITRTQRAAAELSEVMLLIMSLGDDFAAQMAPQTRIVPTDRFGTSAPSRFSASGADGDDQLSLDALESTPAPTMPAPRPSAPAPGSRVVLPTPVAPTTPQAPATRQFDLPVPVAPSTEGLAPAGVNNGQQTQAPAATPASSAVITEIPAVVPNPGASTAQTRSRARRRRANPEGIVTMGPMTVEDTRGPGPWRDGYRFAEDQYPGDQ